MWRPLALGAVRTRAVSTATTRRPHLTLFTGTHCSLCDDMKEVLDELRATTPFTLAFYNIRDDHAPNVQHWRRKYQYDIPVLHVRWHEAQSDDDYGIGTLALLTQNSYGIAPTPLVSPRRCSAQST